VPVPLRSWRAPSTERTATIHPIIRRTIGQYDVHHAVRHGATRATVPPGSVPFVQRFGGSINRNVHLPLIVLAGVYADRTAQGLTPRFRPQEPPTDAEIAAVLHKISQRVIRQLRQRGSLEAGTKDVVPTGDDLARDKAPDRARPLAASVQQRLACGERAGQQGRRRGSGVGDKGARPTLSGPRGASVNGFSLHTNTPMPAHRRNQLARRIRYTARGAGSLERLEQDAHGDLL
jgi:hypothetical protein